MANPQWLPRQIVKPAGPLSYEIKLSDDQIIRRHADHIRLSGIDCDTPESMYDDALDDVLPFSTCQLPTTDNPDCRRSQRERCPPDHFQA